MMDLKLVKLERESVQVTSLCCGCTLSHLKSFFGATSDSLTSRKKGSKVAIFFFRGGLDTDVSLYLV
jgi:hypothetical protein